MQVKLINKRYLVFRSVYTVRNGKHMKVTPKIRKGDEWQNIDLFSKNLEEYFNWDVANFGSFRYIKDSTIDLVKFFEWIMCSILAILFIIYLSDIIRRW